MSTRKVRYKKLNTKTPLPVLREDQIDPSEYESLTIEAQIATGVEQAEEKCELLSYFLPFKDMSRAISRDSIASPGNYFDIRPYHLLSYTYLGLTQLAIGIPSASRPSRGRGKYGQ